MSAKKSTVLIDSWAWIEYFKGSKFGVKARPYIEGKEEVVVSTINVAEVYTFLLRKKKEEAEELIKFLLKTSFVIPITSEIALEAAKNKVEKKMGMADAIVLATANNQKTKILTGDDDFLNEENIIYIGEK